MSVVSLVGYTPVARYDDKPWTDARIDGTTSLNEDWQEITSFDLEPVDDDPASPGMRSFTIEDVDPTFTYLRVVFIDEDGDESETEPVALVDPTMLASVHDVEVRLGQQFSEAKAAQAQYLIAAATQVILAALDQVPGWVPPASAKPMLAALCVEVVVRSRSNPEALGAVSESLGSYSKSTTFAREIPGSGLLLTNAEELMIRRLVYGSNSADATSYDLSLDGNASLLQPMVWIR